MRGGLLSIGEMARATGVNPKSLRYYERLGVIRPAFVDSETGYRYYAPQQKVLVESIVICIRIGVPLKDLARFQSEKGTTDLLALLEEGRKGLLEKRRSLEMDLARIDALVGEVRGFARAGLAPGSPASGGTPRGAGASPERPRDPVDPQAGIAAEGPCETGEYKRSIRQYHAVRMSFDECGFSFESYAAALLELCRAARDAGGFELWFEGLHVCRGRWYAHVAVEGVSPGRLAEAHPGVELCSLPHGNASCRRLEAPTFTEGFGAAIAHAKRARRDALLTEVWDADFDYRSSIVEVASFG